MREYIPAAAECLRWLPRRSASAPFHVGARKLAHFDSNAYTYSLTALIMGCKGGSPLPDPKGQRDAAPFHGAVPPLASTLTLVNSLTLSKFDNRISLTPLLQCRERVRAGYGSKISA